MFFIVFFIVACGGSGGDEDDDTTPDSFSFDSEDDAPLAIFVVSEEILVEGINTEVDIRIVDREPDRDGQGEYSVNGGEWTDEADEVIEGDRVRVRVFTADAIDSVVETTLIISDQEATFSVRTAEVALRAQAGFKALNFNWPLVEGAEFYRLLEDTSGTQTQFAQVGREIEGDVTGLRLDVAVHRFPWEQAQYQLEACTDIECSFTTPIPVAEFMLESIGYVKASAPDAQDNFSVVALSADGDTLAVGAPDEDSAMRGLNAEDTDNDAADAGAVYIYGKEEETWVFQAYIKASNAEAGDAFGTAVALSADGNVLLVGAPAEDSGAMGINGNQMSNDREDSGAAYVFRRQGSAWIQQSYIKAFNSGNDDFFGASVALNPAATRIAIGALFEDGSASGVNGINDDLSADSGAVYVYALAGDDWEEQAYVKASNPGADDHFGKVMALSANGDTLLVGAPGEKSNSRVINSGDQDDSADKAGAAYIYHFADSAWQFATYLKSSNTAADQSFGDTVAMSADGELIAVGATGESSAVVNDQQDISAPGAGAVYVFSGEGGEWSQQAYIKSITPESGDVFGSQLAINEAGDVIAVAAVGDDSSARGVMAMPMDNSSSDDTAEEAGAVYLFEREGTDWQQLRFIKAPNSDAGDSFGNSISMNGNGDVLAVGAPGERGASILIGGDGENNELENSGAVYLY